MAKEKDRKHLIMRVGVISIMILIIFFWVLNIKNVFRTQEEETLKNKEEWADIKKDLNDTLDKMNAGLDKINNADILATTSSPEISSSTIVASSTADISNPIASSSVSSDSPSVVPPILPITEKINSNCPPYINCMPTIGEARACHIPAGCEGITQIAY